MKLSKKKKSSTCPCICPVLFLLSRRTIAEKLLLSYLCLIIKDLKSAIAAVFSDENKTKPDLEEETNKTRFVF